MDTPRASSNGLLTVVCIALLGLCGYKVYHDRLKAEREANQAELAAKQAEIARLAKLAATPTPKATPPPPIEYSIAVSRQVEPLYVQLFSDLNKDNPVDLVPQLTILRERILDKKTGSSKQKEGIYLAGVNLMDGMVSAAEERTDALEELLKATAKPRGSLETDRTVSSSTQHFASVQIQRFREAQKRKKIAIDALFTQLRNAEREWNNRLPKDAPEESYNFAHIPPAIVVPDLEIRANSLEQGAYNQRSWRRSYYDRYGNYRGRVN